MSARRELAAAESALARETAREVAADIIAGVRASFVQVELLVLGGPEGPRPIAWSVSPNEAKRMGLEPGGRAVLYVPRRQGKRPEALNHLYLVEIVGVGVKVGITTQPGRRLATHAKAAAAFGRMVGRAWLSRPHTDARTFELLIQDNHPTEYLPITFEEALDRVTALPDLGDGHLAAGASP